MEWMVDGCGGTLDKFSGEFTSPGYPGFYPSSTTCEWHIIVDNGNTVQIEIEDIWFENSPSCIHSFLAVCILLNYTFILYYDCFILIRFTLDLMILVRNCYVYATNKQIR